MSGDEDDEPDASVQDDAPDSTEGDTQEDARHHGDASEEASEREDEDAEAGAGTGPDLPAYGFRRLRRVSVKGYTRLEAWRLKRPKED